MSTSIIEKQVQEIGILVAGNGPSIESVDFRRLPKDVKIMRMTAYYCEDAYYVGKNVDYYVEYGIHLKDFYFTLHHLNERGEYNINKNGIYITVTNVDDNFPTVKAATPIIHSNKAIAEFRLFHQFYYRQYLTTGITSIGLAACLGFKNIYLAGFDFYSDPDKMYPFELSKNLVDRARNAIQAAKDRGDQYTTSHTSDTPGLDEILKNHPTEMQVKFIKLLQREFPETSFLSVSEKTPLNKMVDMAPLLYEQAWYSPEEKPAGFIRDILPLPKV